MNMIIFPKYFFACDRASHLLYIIFDPCEEAQVMGEGERLFCHQEAFRETVGINEYCVTSRVPAINCVDSPIPWKSRRLCSGSSTVSRPAPDALIMSGPAHRPWVVSPPG